jgi:hypothetical protein
MRKYVQRIEGRGGTVVKVLFYKSEGRWFDSTLRLTQTQQNPQWKELHAYGKDPRHYPFEEPCDEDVHAKQLLSSKNGRTTTGDCNT